jgi:hypothetical protein
MNPKRFERFDTISWSVQQVCRGLCVIFYIFESIGHIHVEIPRLTAIFCSFFPPTFILLLLYSFPHPPPPTTFIYKFNFSRLGVAVCLCKAPAGGRRYVIQHYRLRQCSVKGHVSLMSSSYVCVLHTGGGVWGSSIVGM